MTAILGAFLGIIFVVVGVRSLKLVLKIIGAAFDWLGHWF